MRRRTRRMMMGRGRNRASRLVRHRSRMSVSTMLTTITARTVHRNRRRHAKRCLASRFRRNKLGLRNCRSMATWISCPDRSMTGRVGRPDRLRRGAVRTGECGTAAFATAVTETWARRAKITASVGCELLIIPAIAGKQRSRPAYGTAGFRTAGGAASTVMLTAFAAVAVATVAAAEHRITTAGDFETAAGEGQ
ncbi:MAG: hypothetical protein RLZZ436_2533 [Planctomycetota bacterium]